MKPVINRKISIVSVRIFYANIEDNSLHRKVVTVPDKLHYYDDTCFGIMLRKLGVLSESEVIYKSDIIGRKELPVKISYELIARQMASIDFGEEGFECLMLE